MHLGIIKINGKKIYIDVENEKLISYLYNNKNKEIITNDLIFFLINQLLTCHNKKFLYKDEYDVYLDEETGYKHFFKNDKEDFIKFFNENGYNAIMYKGNSNSSKIKTFIIKGVVICISLSLIQSIAGPLLEKSDITISNTPVEYTESNITSIDVSELKNYILNSNNLSQTDKNILINDNFFEDLANTEITEDRKSSINEKMTDITINYHPDELPSKDILGWYTDLLPNTIFVVNSEDNTTKIHEFIHLTQEYTEYSYIREASADIIGKEYYGIDTYGYKDATSRIQFLMELIGPEVIWNLNFSGDQTEFENKIKEVLPNDKATYLLTLLRQNPANLTQEENKTLNNEIDKMLYEIYNNLTNENNQLNEMNHSGITFDTFESDQNYFIDKQNNSYLFRFTKIMSLEEAEQKNIVKISVAQKKYISKEEAYNSNSMYSQIFPEYEILNDNYQVISTLEDNGELIDYVYNMDQTEKYNLSQAESLGILKCKYWCYEYIPATKEDIGEKPLIIETVENFENVNIKEIYAFEPGYEENKHNILINYLAKEPLIQSNVKTK